MTWNCGQETRTFIRFAIVGLLNTTVIYSLYLLLIYAGLQYLIALTIDYMIGIFSGFLMNRYWTFRQPGVSAKTFLKYAASYAGAFLLNTILLFALVEGMGLDPRIAQIPALFVVVFSNYSMQRLWVFRLH